MLFYNHYLIRCISLCFLSLFLFTGVSAQTLSSPDGNLFLDVCIDEKGTPTYSLEYKGQKVIEKSRLGFRLLPAVFFNDNFEIVGIKEDSADFVWYPVWGENSGNSRLSSGIVGRAEATDYRLFVEYAFSFVRRWIRISL